jgi:hypothetical protein
MSTILTKQATRAAYLSCPKTLAGSGIHQVKLAARHTGNYLVTVPILRGIGRPFSNILDEAMP